MWFVEEKEVEVRKIEIRYGCGCEAEEKDCRLINTLNLLMTVTVFLKSAHINLLGV